MNTFSEITAALRSRVGGSLAHALDLVCVEEPGAYEPPAGLENWYAVSTPDHSIVAYFSTESEAFAYRLNLINHVLNY